ncbi:MAG: hypothetical protein K9J79_05815 [Desulfobacteraceae bacterium]|nr:hypothetical protein [Desulfobacteraceae bacterium]
MIDEVNDGKTIFYEFYTDKNAGHGFGLGVGTDAEGWIDHAIAFWENQSAE